jgi:hypothetical protein
MIQQVRLIDTIEAAPDSWRVKGGYPESRLVSVGARLVCWVKHFLTTLKTHRAGSIVSKRVNGTTRDRCEVRYRYI